MQINKLTYLIITIFVLNAVALFTQDKYILQIKPKTKKAQIQSSFQELNISNFRQVFSVFSENNNENTILSNKFTREQIDLIDNLSRYYQFELPKNTNNNEIIEQIKNNPNIEFIESNFIYSIHTDFTSSPNDKLYTEQWALKAISAERAWQKATGKGITIAVVDTGIDFEHPDLENSLWINSAEDINGNGRFDPWPYFEQQEGLSGDINWIDDDGNGYIDDVIGYDFVNQEYANFGDWTMPDNIPFDEAGHGTSVSGVISAQANNSIGIAGLAFDSKIMTLRAFDATGNGEADDIAASIVYAALNGAKVMNFSFGDRNKSRIMYDAIRFAYSMGCVMFTSSGNNNWFFNQYPSMYEEVINVGGINPTSTRFGRGNYGSMLDFSAPAEAVMTTSAREEYKKESGTSLAAPYASATAALLLELNPKLTPVEIRGILSETAEEADIREWNPFYGSGILNAGNAVNYTSTTIIEITTPLNEQNFDRDKIQNIELKGTIITPFFNYYRVYIGEGILPQQWTDISEDVKTQIKNNKITDVDISNLKDTVYTISVKISLHNNKTYERRVQINVTSSANKIEYLTFKHINAYFGKQRYVVISAGLNKNTDFFVRFRPKGSQDSWQQVSGLLNKANKHVLRVGEEATAGVAYEAIAYAYSDKDTTKREFEFTRLDDYFVSDNFANLPQTMGRSYIKNFVGDVNGNGLMNFATADMPNLGVNSVILWQYENGNIIPLDTLNEPWIPIGFGESNGDGRGEILLTSSAKTRIYQYQDGNKNKIFQENIYDSDDYHKHWAEHFVDLNNNGRHDIIVSNDTSYFALQYIDGAYKKFAVAELPVSLRRYGIELGGEFGDLTGNSTNNLVIANRFGNLYVYEFSDNQFELKYVDSTDISIRNQGLQLLDVTGDGINEIVQLVHGSTILFGDYEGSNSIWYLRVLKNVGNYQYETLWEDYFYGVRAGFVDRLGFSYRNSISGGDLTGDGKEEVIISTFPNLYILNWNNDTQRMEALWNYPATNSSDVLVYDFNGNGINEIAFNAFDRVVFYEFNPKTDRPHTPYLLEGEALTTTLAKLKWRYDSEAEYFQVFYIDRRPEGVFAVPFEEAITTELEIEISNLAAGTHYEFVVVAFDNQFAEPISNFSEIADVYMFERGRMLTANVINSRGIYAGFSAKLPYHYVEPSMFSLRDLSGKIYTPVSTVVTADTGVVITFADNLPYGNLTLKSFEFRDYWGNRTLESTIIIENIQTPEIEELYLTRLEVLGLSLLKLTFSEPVNFGQATNIENYSIAPYGQIIFAEPDIFDNTSVLLTLNSGFRSYVARGINYTLTARNIFSLIGSPMTKTAGNTLAFALAAEHLRDVYAFPNPARVQQDNEIYFGNLSPRAEIKIMTLEGIEINTVYERDGNGGTHWDLLDKSGKRIKSGIYMYRVEGEDIDGRPLAPVFRKFAVIP